DPGGAELVAEPTGGDVVPAVVCYAEGAARGHGEVVGQARVGNAVVVRRHAVLLRQLSDVARPDHLGVAAVLQHDDEDMRGVRCGRRFGRGAGRGCGQDRGRWNWTRANL